VEYKRLGLFEKQNESRKLKFDVYRLPWEDFQRELVSQRTPDGGIDDRTNGKLYEDFANFKDANARLAYKARPLNGIWATAPYLHNGAVRNLYQLLSPVAERDKRFFLGSKQFDPVYVGLANEKFRGGFEMNTDLSGNRNSGHEFRDTQADEGVWVKGVIGPFLTHQDRMALIEYLKSL
jgi:cytochrome c peroxidase